MSITQIIDEVERLEPADRKRLMAHLVLQRLRENEEYRKEISQRFENELPSAWTRVDQIEGRRNEG